MRRLATIACLAAAARDRAGRRARRASSARRSPARLVSCATGPTRARRTADVHRADAGDRRHRADVDPLRPAPAHAGRGGASSRSRCPAWGVLAALAGRARRRSSTRSGSGACARPARYRARVRFRWHDASGRVQRRTQSVTTRTCRQPDPRPDLTRGRADGGPAASAPITATYLLDVRNTGRARRCAVRRRPRDRAGCRSRRCASPAWPPGEDQRREHPRPALRAGVDGAVRARRGRGRRRVRRGRRRRRPACPVCRLRLARAHRCSTHAASNWRPAQRRSSASASSTGIAAL